MIKITDKTNCCGCSACVQICPKSALHMQSDKTGFLYPLVEKKKCVECGLCEKICPILNEGIKRMPTHVYAVKNKDEKTRLQSSSGGVFSILAEGILNAGGVVYGAGFDSSWKVRHIGVTTKEELGKLRGSKYVQSIIGNCFLEVKEHLRNGRKVLFSGTPCQVAGLNEFLRKKYDNLTTVDFVCHGVPNPRIWGEYLEKEKSALRAVVGKSSVLSSLNSMPSIEGVKFRDKSNGWKKYRFVLSLAESSDEGKKSTVLSSYVWEHPYMLLFLENYILRPSCHYCHFRYGRSGATYTIADYWQIERFYSDFFDDKGVSLFMQYDNSDINSILEKTENIETTYDEACYGNPCICHSCPPNKDSKYFYFVHDTLHLDIDKSLAVSRKISQMRLLLHDGKDGMKRRVKRVLRAITGTNYI